MAGDGNHVYGCHMTNNPSPLGKPPDYLLDTVNGSFSHFQCVSDGRVFLYFCRRVFLYFRRPFFSVFPSVVSFCISVGVSFCISVGVSLFYPFSLLPPSLSFIPFPFSLFPFPLSLFPPSLSLFLYPFSLLPPPLHPPFCPFFDGRQKMF